MSEERPDPTGSEELPDDSASTDEGAGTDAVGTQDADDPVAVDGDAQGTCQNCGVLLHGTYCHACGQRHIPRLRTRELMRRFADSVLNIADLGNGLWATLLEGTRNPGRLALRYVNGERVRFVNPIGYFLIGTTLMFLLLTLTSTEWIQGMTEMYRAQWTAMGLDPEEMFGPEGIFRKGFGLRSVEDYSEVVFIILQQTQTYLSLLLCLVAAGLLYGLLSGYTFAELVVFELYATAQAKLFFVVASPILLITPTAFWFVLGPALQLGVLAFAGLGFFGERWKGGLLPPLTYVGAYLVWLVISVLVGIVTGIGVATGVIGG